MHRLGQRFLPHFLKNEDGAVVVKYAFMLAVVVVVCLTAIVLIGSNGEQLFQRVPAGTPAETASPHGGNGNANGHGK